MGSSAANGDNHYAIKTTLNGGSGSQPQVYAGIAGTDSAMEIYYNTTSPTSYGYLAQINCTNAGKTMEVDLYDVGDVTGNATLYLKMPTASGWTDATFNWRNTGTTLSTSGTTTSNVTSVTTATNGNNPYNGDWLALTVQIPPTYCASPPTAPQSGWWKIKYTFTGGAPYDDTTWRAQIINAPVHLVP